MQIQKTYKIIVTVQLIMFCMIWNNAFSQVIAGNARPTGSSPGNGKFLTRPFENKVFIEEQGQFKKSVEENKITFPGTILFAVNNPEFEAYFTSTGITFLFSKTELIADEQEEKSNEKEPLTKWEIVNMQWVNSNPSMQISAKEKVNSYYTYGRYLDNSQYDHVSAFKKLYYSNIYDGVDAEFELPEKGGIKYQFIVHAGFNIPAIAYRMDGTKNLYLDEKGNLHIEATLGKLTDNAPVAFTKSSKVPVKYSVTGSLVEIIAENKTLTLAEDLVIDPWLINPAIPSADRAYDIQEDSIGNIYVYGGNSSNSQAQKYNSGGALQWTYNTSHAYYGDIAVANSGSMYLLIGIPGQINKMNTLGAVIGTGPAGSEYWRLAFNKSKTILALGGNFQGSSLARLDTSSLAITNLIGYPPDIFSMATDCNGDIYSLGTYTTHMLRKTNANFTPAVSVLSGFSIGASGNSYVPWAGTNSVTVNGPYVYIYDGLQLRRFNKSNLSFIDNATVPNGLSEGCSGITFDYCGNIYVGTTSTIEKYDMLLNHISSIAAPNVVYDILLANNGDLLACGNTFVTNLGATCPSPPQLTATATSTNVSCNPGTATILAVGGTLPYSYLWQPSGQSTALATGLTPGTYTYLVNDAFCQSRQDSVIVLLTSPLSLSLGVVVNESCPNSLNGSATVNASAGTGPYSYSWNTNPVQNTQTATGLSAGTYIATVVDADICTDTVSITITRNQNPAATFSNTTVCNGSGTQFTDNSTTASGSVSTWRWDFGDTSPFNTTSGPSHLYANAGNYNVTLIVNNNFGCGDTITKPVQVYYNPIAGFTFSNVCLGDSMHFLNTSSVDNSTSIATYLWVFGNASPTSNLQNPNHYYSNAGTYTVTLVTTTADGCSNAASIPVKTFDPPTSAFTFSNTCLLNSATFTNTSLNPTMGSTASWSWDFGDGSPLNTSVWSLNHVFTSPGNYQVTLITHSSNLGCPDTVQNTITVFPMPIANFGFTNVCLNQPMNFNDLSTVSSGTIASQSWNFGDNSPLSTLQNPNHIYTNPGTYTVSLIVTTNNTCKDTITKNVVVHPLPVAQFSSENVCDGSIVPFTNLSNILITDLIQSWAWTFGDGSPVYNNQNSSHRYNNAGSFSVQLMVFSNFGCPDSITKTTIVNPNPVVNFTTIDTIGCEPLCVNFQNLSSITSGTNLTWLWNVGDGSPINNTEHPTHCYTNDSLYLPNSFNINLTVTSDSGCVSTIAKNNYITVYPNPHASFTVQPQTTTITDPVISTKNLSTGANFWNWNFGDLDTSSLFNPSAHTYADTGTYTITLITSTQYNCIDTAYETIIIEPDFVFYIPNAFTPNDDGVNDSFSGKGIFISKYEMTIFDRWGNSIFFSEDMNKPWDGMANHGSEIAQSDIYIYSFKITDIKRRKHVYKGVITLVR